MSQPSHDTDAYEGDHTGPTVQTYYTIAVALALFTMSSFVFNLLVTGKVFSALLGFLCILGVAVCKAGLVGAYFMHLKYEWNKLYFLIIPVFVLGVMMMIVLLPDMVFAWAPNEHLEFLARVDRLFALLGGRLFRERADLPRISARTGAAFSP